MRLKSFVFKKCKGRGWRDDDGGNMVSTYFRDRFPLGGGAGNGYFAPSEQPGKQKPAGMEPCGPLPPGSRALLFCGRGPATC